MHSAYRRGLLWMLTPYLLRAALLVLVPALLAGGIAFFRYDGLSPARFAGWQIRCALRCRINSAIAKDLPASASAS